MIKVSEVLSGRIKQAFSRPAYRPMALRLIAALSVHRLTTGGDIYVPIGATAAEPRDTLCLFQPDIEDMGGEPATNLLGMVVTCLGEVLKTVNGHFSSKAPDTAHDYLDLRKDIDDDIRRSLSTYAAALDLAATASGNAKSIYFSKAQDALRAMSKWLQEKQMTALTVTYGGKSKPLQDWVSGVSMRDKARLGSDERITFREVINDNSKLRFVVE